MSDIVDFAHNIIHATHNDAHAAINIIIIRTADYCQLCCLQW